MKIKDIVEELELKVLTGADKLDAEVTGAYTSDLLSDVMGNARKGEVWITMQTHSNIVAVASLKELAAIIIVNGGKPDENTIKKAGSEGIAVLSTEKRSFTICGKLYKILEENAMV
jgi:predicted transcriptional regulator